MELEIVVMAWLKALVKTAMLGRQTLFITSVDGYPMKVLLFVVFNTLPLLKFPSELIVTLKVQLSGKVPGIGLKH
jgi:hypothetical protein